MQESIDALPAERAAGENVVLLFDVSPVGYTAIMAALPDHRGARIAYDGDVLEIMAPSSSHEGAARVLDAFFRAIATECHLTVESFGSLTLRRSGRGAEPDSCFYLGDRAQLIRDRDEIDLASDPPPNIVVEIDISRGRIDKQRLYAKLGVPEFWRYDGQALKAFRLSAGRYVETPTSATLPWLRIADVERFLNRWKLHGQTETIAAWHAWLRKKRKP